MKFILGKLFLAFKFTMFSSWAFNAIVRNTNANSFPFSFQVRWLKRPISIQFSDLKWKTPHNSKNNCTDHSWENMYLDIGTWYYSQFISNHYELIYWSKALKNRFDANLPVNCCFSCVQVWSITVIFQANGFFHFV